MNNKNLKKQGLAWVAVITAMVTILVACGPAPTPETVEVEKLVTQEVEVEKVVEVEVEKLVTPTPGGVKMGGTLTVGMPGDTKTLDPHVSQLWVWNQMRNQMFDQLIMVDRYTLDLAPMLATEWNWEDDTTLVMKLREGVKFHNGEPFTAEDVKYSVDRVLDPDLPTEFRSRFASMDSVEVRGPYEVVFHLKEKDATLIHVFPGFDIISKSIPEDEIATNPVGTGPFKFVEWKLNEVLIEERNPDYWGGPDLPRLDKLVFKILTENQTRIASLLAGDIDVDNQTALKDVARLATTPGIAVYRTPPLAHNVIMYVNTRKPNLADPLVRKALLYGMDRKTMAEVSFAGLAEPANSPAGPGNPAYNEEMGELYPYDLEKAKELLAEAGWTDTNGDGFVDKDGQNLTLELSTFPGYFETECEFLQANMVEVGIDIQIEKFELATWSNRIIKEAIYDLSFDGYGGGWQSPAALYMPMHFFSPGPENFLGLTEGLYPDYDEAFKAAKQELDPEKANELWKEVQTLWAEYVPGFTILRDSQAQAHQDFVKDYRGLVPLPELEFAWLDK